MVIQPLGVEVVAPGVFPDLNLKVSHSGVELGRDGIPSPEEVSKWVLERISEVSRVLGLSFERHEEKVLRLFSAVKESWRKGTPSKAGVKPLDTGRRRNRELDNLACSINYEHRGSTVGSDSRRTRGGPLLLK
ncbi:hypothetical protein CsSME_00020125 [Camellia sinensis var. sinensis]